MWPAPVTRKRVFPRRMGSKGGMVMNTAAFAGALQTALQGQPHIRRLCVVTGRFVSQERASEDYTELFFPALAQLAFPLPQTNRMCSSPCSPDVVIRCVGFML